MSLTPPEPLVPDFRVSTEYYTVENTAARYGDQDAYHYLDEPDELQSIIAKHMGAD